MAIKYYPVPEKRQMIAVLSNCKYDALNKIDKMTRETGFCFSPYGTREYDSYIMPDTFKVVVTCDPRDTYTIEDGEKFAKAKLMRNYRKSLNKRIDKFTKAVAKFSTSIDSKMT